VNGREFVVFCAAAQATTHTHDLPGHPALRDPIPGAYVAFALPKISLKIAANRITPSTEGR
jgi:quinoprotein glucose dehydrogenase